MRSGVTATRLGLGGWPASAEATIVERDLTLAAETGGWIHFTHLSTAAALGVIRRARAGRGARDVRRDAAPPGPDRRVGRGRPALRVGGPRRRPGGARSGDRLRRELPGQPPAAAPPATPSPSWPGSLDGSIDAIATDHAPHPPERKTGAVRRGGAGAHRPGDGPRPRPAGGACRAAEPAEPAERPVPAAGGPHRRVALAGRRCDGQPGRLRPGGQLAGRARHPGQPVG